MSYFPAWKFLGAVTLGAVLSLAPDPCRPASAAQRLPVILPQIDMFSGDEPFVDDDIWRTGDSGGDGEALVGQPQPGDWEFHGAPHRAPADIDYDFVPLRAPYAEPADMADDNADASDDGYPWDAEMETSAGTAAEEQDAWDRELSDDEEEVSDEEFAAKDDLADRDGDAADDEWFCRRYSAAGEPCPEEEAVSDRFDDGDEAMTDEGIEGSQSESDSPVDRAAEDVDANLSWRYQYWYPVEKYGAAGEADDDTAADQVDDESSWDTGDSSWDSRGDDAAVEDDGAAAEDWDRETSSLDADEPSLKAGDDDPSSSWKYDWLREENDFGYRSSPLSGKYGHYYDEASSWDGDGEADLDAIDGGAADLGSEDDEVEYDLSDSSAAWAYGHEAYGDEVTADEEYDESYGAEDGMEEAETLHSGRHDALWDEESDEEPSSFDDREMTLVQRSLDSRFAAGLELFASSPVDLLLLPDQELIRQLNGLSLRYGQREMALNDYLESLGSEAMGFAMQYASITGKDAASLSDDLTATVALLAAFRLYEQESLGVGEAVDALERTLESRPESWVDATIALACSTAADRPSASPVAGTSWNVVFQRALQSWAEVRGLVEKLWTSSTGSAVKQLLGRGGAVENTDSAYHDGLLEEFYQR